MKNIFSAQDRVVGTTSKRIFDCLQYLAVYRDCRSPYITYLKPLVVGVLFSSMFAQLSG